MGAGPSLDEIEKRVRVPPLLAIALRACPPAAAYGPSGQPERHPRGTDENRAASPSAIVGWVSTASRSAV